MRIEYQTAPPSIELNIPQTNSEIFRNLLKLGFDTTKVTALFSIQSDLFSIQSEVSQPQIEFRGRLTDFLNENQFSFIEFKKSQPVKEFEVSATFYCEDDKEGFAELINTLARMGFSNNSPSKSRTLIRKTSCKVTTEEGEEGFMFRPIARLNDQKVSFTSCDSKQNQTSKFVSFCIEALPIV